MILLIITIAHRIQHWIRWELHKKFNFYEFEEQKNEKHDIYLAQIYLTQIYLWILFALLIVVHFQHG